MLIDDFKNKGITISLRILNPCDLMTGWEIKDIVDNPDIFDDFFSKYPLSQIDTFDDFYFYLLTLKLQSLSAVVPHLLQDDHKVRITTISKSADDLIQSINPGSIIKFINKNIVTIFNSDISKHDMRLVTLELIAKYNTGISKDTFLYLCEQFGYLLIDQFDSFEAVFEREPDLFNALFPSGKLDDINPFRFEKVLEIWHHIIIKGKSNLKDTVSKNVIVLFNDVEALAKSATIDNVIQIEGTVRKFHLFLQGIQSPMANKFAECAKTVEKLLSQNIKERGQSFQYEIPVNEIIRQWKTTENRELRLLSITHDHMLIKGQLSFVSRIDKKPEPKSALFDLVSTNIPTDDYFSMSHQQMLAIYASVGNGTILGLLRNPETVNDYYSLLSSAVAFISQSMHAQGEELEQDIIQLISMVQLMVENHNAEEKIVHSLCYGTAMFICAFTEKLLRLFYMDLVKDSLYIPINKATLGDLLSENNTDMVKIFGLHHIKNLSFFLMQTPHKKIGHNIRNNMAHWSNLSVSTLSPTLVTQVLWLFTDILNTVFWYYLKDSMDGNQ